MSTDIASHRHAPHRFGMRRDASFSANFFNSLPRHVRKAESCGDVEMLWCRLDLLMAFMTCEVVCLGNVLYGC